MIVEYSHPKHYQHFRNSLNVSKLNTTKKYINIKLQPVQNELTCLKSKSPKKRRRAGKNHFDASHQECRIGTNSSHFGQLISAGKIVSGFIMSNYTQTNKTAQMSKVITLNENKTKYEKCLWLKLIRQIFIKSVKIVVYESTISCTKFYPVYPD